MASDLTENVTLSMFVTHVLPQDNWLKFWGQTDLVSTSNVEATLASRKSEFDAAAGFLHSCQIQLNGIFCAPFEDGQWHRVRIVYCPPNNPLSVVVQFIDFGNKQTVSVGDIRKLEDFDLVTVPPQATECYLADVRAPQQGSWSPQALKFCEAHLLNKRLTAQVVGKFDNFPIVRLFVQNSVFAHVLIHHKLAVSSVPMENVSISPTGASWQQKYAGDPYRVGLLDVGQACRVYVSSVASPQKFFLQMTADEPKRVALLQSLEEYALKRSLVPLDQVLPGTPCVARSTEDRQYQRAIVLGMHQNSNQCNILFVDTGIGELVQPSKLFVLPPNLKMLPVQAFECTLGPNANFSAAAFQSVTEGKVLDCRMDNKIVIEGGTFTYLVSLTYQGLDVADLIIHNSVSGVRQPSIARYRYPKLKKNTKYEVCLTVINSLSDFYCRLAQNISQNNEMILALESEFKHSAGEMVSEDELVQGQAVCAKFSGNSSWYRGEVLEVYSNGHVQIKFSDYGNVEIVAVKDLRMLSARFLELPAQAIHLSLAGLEAFPLEKLSQRQVVDKFEKETRDRSLTIEVVEMLEEKHWSVFLHSGQKGSFNVEMMAFLNGMSDVGVKEPELDKVESIYVAFVVSKTEFFGQLQKFSVNNLDMILESLGKYYSNTVPESTPFRVGQFVCTKYSEDDNYYRAKIVSMSGNRAEVFFIDYGCKEMKNVTEIRLLLPQFTHLPQQGFMCKLAGNLDAVPEAKMKDALCESILEVEIVKKAGESYEVQLNSDTQDNRKILDLIEAAATCKGYSSPSVPAGVVENVVITDGADPSEFWCQLQTASNQLDELMTDMEKYYSDISGKKDEMRQAPKLGMPCVAMYSLDSGWYRAVVTGQTSAGKIEVRFVDYGNSEMTEASKMKVIRPEFLKLPQQALNCCLSDVEEQVWHPDIIRVFKELTLDKEFTAVFQGKDGLSNKMKVQLTSSSGNRVDGASLLHQQAKTFGQRTISPKENVQKSLPHNQWTNDSSSRSNPNPTFQNDSLKSKQSGFQSKWGGEAQSNGLDIPPKEIAQEKPVPTDFTAIDVPLMLFSDVSVVHVVSLSEFYCQLRVDNTKLLTTMDKIRSDYSKLAKYPCAARVGTPCCAISSEDQAWYRAQVTAVFGNQATVQFIDYGNSEKVALDSLKGLKPEYFELPAQALKCRLNNICPPQGNSWSDESIREFKKLVLDKSQFAQFVKKQSDGTYEINIFDSVKLEEIVLNKELVVSGQAKSDRSTAFLSRNPFTTHPYVYPDFKPGFKESVTIVWFVSPSEFYCQLSSQADVFKTEMASMQVFYNKLEEMEGVVDRPHPALACVSQFSEDNAWYRSHIVHVKGNNVGVRYVDYGNCEEVVRKKVKHLTEEFSDLQVQALKCGVLDVEPLNSSWQLSQTISKCFQGNMECTFRSRVDGTYMVDLDNNGKSVAQMLVAAGVATSSQPEDYGHFPQMKVSLNSDPEAILIVYAQNATSFYCQFVESTDTLERLMETIQAREEGDNATGVDNLEEGDACVAKYSEDNRWYRGIVQSCLEDGKYQILFVDYGNTEIVCSTEVRRPKKAYLSLPQQALSCRLYGLPSDVPEDDSISFGNALLEKEELSAIFLKKKDGVFAVTLLEDGQDFGTVTFGTLEDEPEEIQLFQSPVIPAGKCSAVVSQVSSPSSFYVQLSEQEDQLNKLAVELDKLYNAGEGTPPSNVTIGLACCSKWSVDGAWYRAVVTDIRGSDIVVRFVDFGNSETITADNMRVVDDEFLSVPPFAIECRFPNAKCPAGKEQEFVNILNEKVVVVKFKSSSEPVDVDVFEDGADVAQRLSGTWIIIIENPDVSTPPPAVDMEVFPDPTFPSGECTVVVSQVASVGSFFVQFPDKEEDLINMATRLDQIYSSGKGDVPPNIVPGMACCTRYSADEVWYRAVVTDVEGSEVFVRFIDYGNSETTTSTSIRTVIDEFLAIPPFAIECRFVGAECVPGKEQDVIDALSEKELTVNFKSQTQPVSVDALENGTDVLQTFVDSGLVVVHEADVAVARALDDSVPEAIKDLPEALQPRGILESDLGKHGFLPPTISTGQHSAIVSYVVSPSCFFVQLTDQQEALADLTARLDELYGTNEAMPAPDLHVGMACCAKYSVDESWYRAVVTKFEGPEVTVKFVDYGNNESVTVENIRAVADELFAVFPFAIECRLAGATTTPGKEQDVIDSLDGREAEVNFRSDREPVEVYMTIHGVDLLQTMVEKAFVTLQPDVIAQTEAFEDLSKLSAEELARTSYAMLEVDSGLEQPEEPTDMFEVLSVEESLDSVVSFKSARVPVNQKSHVVVTHIVSPGEFYVQLCISAEQFETLAKDITETYSNISEEEFSVKNPQVGQTCIALFSGDLAWHRAQIVSVSDKIKVKFVDYGNSEEVDPVDVKELTSSVFYELPAQAVRCSLLDVTPLGSDEWDSKTCEAFEEIIGEGKTFLAEFVHRSDVVSVKMLDVGLDIAQLLADRELANLDVPESHSFTDLSAHEVEEVDDSMMVIPSSFSSHQPGVIDESVDSSDSPSTEKISENNDAKSVIDKTSSEDESSIVVSTVDETSFSVSHDSESAINNEQVESIEMKANSSVDEDSSDHVTSEDFLSTKQLDPAEPLKSNTTDIHSSEDEKSLATEQKELSASGEFAEVGVSDSFVGTEKEDPADIKTVREKAEIEVTLTAKQQSEIDESVESKVSDLGSPTEKELDFFQDDDTTVHDKKFEGSLVNDQQLDAVEPLNENTLDSDEPTMPKQRESDDSLDLGTAEDETEEIGLTEELNENVVDHSLNQSTEDASKDCCKEIQAGSSSLVDGGTVKDDGSEKPVDDAFDLNGNNQEESSSLEISAVSEGTSCSDQIISYTVDTIPEAEVQRTENASEGENVVLVSFEDPKMEGKTEELICDIDSEIKGEVVVSVGDSEKIVESIDDGKSKCKAAIDETATDVAIDMDKECSGDAGENLSVFEGQSVGILNKPFIGESMFQDETKGCKDTTSQANESNTFLHMGETSKPPSAFSFDSSSPLTYTQEFFSSPQPADYISPIEKVVDDKPRDTPKLGGGDNNGSNLELRAVPTGEDKEIGASGEGPVKRTFEEVNTGEQ